MGDLSQIEGIQLTVGNLIGLCVLIGVIAGGVWAVAKIRNSDKEDIEKGYTGAINRVDTKHSKETDVLHARVNELSKDVNQLIGYKDGVKDANKN